MEQEEKPGNEAGTTQAREYTAKQLIKYHATVMHNLAERELTAQAEAYSPIASLQATLQGIKNQAIESPDGHMKAILIREDVYRETERDLELTKEITAGLKNTQTNIRAHETVEQLLFHCRILNHISTRPDC